MRQFSRNDPEYEHLIASTSKAVVILDPDLNFEDCNEAAALLFRCSRGSMPARCAADFLPATQLGGIDSVAAMHQAARAALADIPQSMLSQLLAADGAPFEGIVQFEAVRLDGTPRIVARIRNISPLREAEQALSDSEERLRQVLENTTAVVFIKDPEGKYLFVNRRFCEMFGRTQEELHGAHDVDLFPPHIAAQLRADDRRVFQLRAAQEIEEALVVNGQPCTYMAIKFPLLNGAGDPYAVCGIATDITGRKRSEAALRSAALAVSTAEGDALFQELTRYLATTLGVECAFIARCSTPENDRVRTLSIYADGAFEPAMEYGLPGTVCGTVVGQEFRFIRDGVQRVYRDDPTFVDLDIQGYAAYPMSDSSSRPLGLIAIMSRHPLGDR
ncbi:MAG: PAS domain-containing protein, partial [Candidatus Hydrogenedentes bacterium]|nr:PAS domain-containing protein [Candidatus Hydrogenedentota bacterium]